MSKQTDNQPFDDVFAHIAHQSGGLPQLFDHFFSFLHRKTDFYVQVNERSHSASMGFPIGYSERLLMESFRKYSFKDYESMNQNPPSSSSPSSLTENNNKINNNAVKIITSSASSSSSTATTIESKSSMIRRPLYTNDGLQLPIGNGGMGPNYYWTQTLKELTICIDVSNTTKGKDIEVTIKPTYLKVGIKGQNTLMDGELEDSVKIDDSLWTLVKGNSISTNSLDDSQIIITLEKSRRIWWKFILVGHPEIDTTKIDSSQKIDEYDEDTQAAIRKLVHEQRNKAKLMDNDVDEEPTTFQTKS